MAAMFLVEFVAFIEVERRIDRKTVQEAKLQTQQANVLIHRIQQWARVIQTIREPSGINQINMP